MGIPPSLEEAARSLGASRRRAFMRVTLPASMPGILSGSLLVFALSIRLYRAGADGRISRRRLADPHLSAGR